MDALAVRTVAEVQGKDLAVVAGLRLADAGPLVARVTVRADQTVIAACRVGQIDATLGRVAGIVGARIAVVTGLQARLAGLRQRASLRDRACIGVGAIGVLAARLLANEGTPHDTAYRAAQARRLAATHTKLVADVGGAEARIGAVAIDLARLER